GSTFWFTVEFDRAREPLTPPAPPPALRGGRHVLIVDDNETNRKLLERLCVAWELPHGVAASAAAALAHLRWLAQTGKPFDLVLLDHHMPGVDGLALARAIRDDPLIPRPTLVMLSSRGERLTRAEMKANGIDACESKPIYPEKLRALLGRLLAPVAAVAKPAAPAGGLRAARPAEILVVEDNPLNQKVTLMQVRNLGHAADAAENGREAIAALRRKHYDVVLMDVHMPVMDGQEATRFIRRAQAAREPGFPCDLRIIATTASAQPEDRESCLRAGMDDFLTKPVQAEALQALLDRLLADSGPGAAGDGQRP
ncbi:MAG TPA: response regulator, partial [Opitutus sp.]|nr:response regulator [Opitutus sp.]